MDTPLPNIPNPSLVKCFGFCLEMFQILELMQINHVLDMLINVVGNEGNSQDQVV
jgi:hypothetical protein